MVGVSILDAAKEAWAQARNGREADAREAMGRVLTPFDVTKLECVDMRITDGVTLFVFRDPKDDIHLAARTQGTGWVINVVSDSAGWTVQGKPVGSLAHLHELVAAQHPEVTA